jgi:hypothetical protein
MLWLGSKAAKQRGCDMSLNKGNKIILAEIMGAHSPQMIRAKVKAAMQVIDASLGDDNLEIEKLKTGSEILNQAIYRLELLIKAKELAAICSEYDQE